jgi:hypothetical protein
VEAGSTTLLRNALASGIFTKNTLQSNLTAGPSTREQTHTHTHTHTHTQHEHNRYHLEGHATLAVKVW